MASRALKLVVAVVVVALLYKFVVAGGEDVEVDLDDLEELDEA